MSFFAILFALLIEQARPLARSNPMHAGLRAWALSVNRNFDTGSPALAWLAWCLGVLVPPLAVLAVHWLLQHFIGWPLALVWNVAVLYITLGFRQFSHHFTGIRDALEVGDAGAARARLAQWKQVDASELPRSEVVRHVIEYSVIAAHRHVFGVLAWYSVCAALGLGPAGAVLYRLAEFMARYWAPRTATAHPASSALQGVAAQAWMVIDWLPARLTALCFAVVGSFEEAIDGWRFHAQRFPSDNDGVVLAATAGAINVRLGGEALRSTHAEAYVTPGYEAGAHLGDSGSTPGREPEVGHLRSVVGLVWRSVVVWMLLLALLTLARLLG
ncbi:CobD/CbiB family protein [Melaminivora jejuensis]|uniref:CobD/CbiB family protein n=1 Tax=Melaminivora jejuensis TaxID=1267217 RepID=UPI001AE0271D|nr:CobD/CbiB family protein [Melaminivora jejuensis]UHJ65989.1 CobD/CbiB family protein [Melaminivora jejuensis]